MILFPALPKMPRAAGCSCQMCWWYQQCEALAARPGREYAAGEGTGKGEFCLSPPTSQVGPTPIPTRSNSSKFRAQQTCVGVFSLETQSLVSLPCAGSHYSHERDSRHEAMRKEIQCRSFQNQTTRGRVFCVGVGFCVVEPARAPQGKEVSSLPITML